MSDLELPSIKKEIELAYEYRELARELLKSPILPDEHKSYVRDTLRDIDEYYVVLNQQYHRVEALFNAQVREFANGNERSSASIEEEIKKHDAKIGALQLMRLFTVIADTPGNMRQRFNTRNDLNLLDQKIERLNLERTKAVLSFESMQVVKDAELKYKGKRDRAEAKWFYQLKESLGLDDETAFELAKKPILIKYLALDELKTEYLSDFDPWDTDGEIF